MKLVPLFDNVVIKRDDAMTESEGGIALPETAQDRPRRGEIIAVGPGKLVNGALVPPVVSEGWKVLFAFHAGVQVDPSDDSILILQESEILAVVKEEK